MEQNTAQERARGPPEYDETSDNLGRHLLTAGRDILRDPLDAYRVYSNVIDDMREWLEEGVTREEMLDACDAYARNHTKLTPSTDIAAVELE